MPIRVMVATSHPTPDTLLMGDAFNMRHLITRRGMTVALFDIVVLRDLLRPLHDLSDTLPFANILSPFFYFEEGKLKTALKPMASTINTLANVMHNVSTTTWSDLAIEGMQQTSLGYLSLGGRFSDGLMALISGLNPNPLSLLLHLFAMAIYGFGRLLLPFSSPKRMWTGARLIWVASAILFPLIKSEGVRPMFFPLTMLAYYRAPPVNSKDTAGKWFFV
ncbi:hypothetical protein REPUB_Repub04eG0021000 [Reevesia pubescens]